MEVKNIIKFGVPVPEEALAAPNDAALNVSEFFYDTIQGEGLNLGMPAAFLRLAGCPVNCQFCDTAEVWKTCQRVKISWLIDQIVETGLSEKLRKESEILVVTGGSPLLQQDALLEFFRSLQFALKRLPFVEMENECYFVPRPEMFNFINWWNNSPKLSNSGVSKERRYKPGVLEILGEQGNATWKFVVKDEKDWEEIQKDFIDTKYIAPFKICLMPMGATQEEYFANREKVVELAVKHGVRYSPREHISIWDKKTGI